MRSKLFCSILLCENSQCCFPLLNLQNSSSNTKNLKAHFCRWKNLGFFRNFVMRQCQRSLCNRPSFSISFPLHLITVRPVRNLSRLNIYVQVSSPWCWCLVRNLTYKSLHCSHYWKYIQVLSAIVKDTFVNLRTWIILMVTPKINVPNVIASPSEACHLSHAVACLLHNLVSLISGTFLFSLFCYST